MNTNQKNNIKKLLLILLGLFTILIVILFIIIKLLAPQTALSDWKRFTLPKEQLSLKYPSNWTSSTTGESALANGKNYSYKLTSPNNFELNFQIVLNGLGGACPKDCQAENLENSTLGALNFYTKPLYIVVNGVKSSAKDQPPITKFNVIETKDCFSNVCYGFESKNTSGEIIITGTFKDSKGKDLYKDPTEFANSADVKTAISILETLTY